MQLIGVLSVLLLLMLSLVALSFIRTPISLNIEELPSNYNESESDYDRYVESSMTYETTDLFTSVTLESWGTVESFATVDTHATQDDISLILLSDSDAWKLVSNGLFDGYPTQPYKAIKDKVQQVYKDNMVQITVDCWYWEDPSDDLNMSKVTVQKKFAVNREVAQLFLHVFEDIYNDPTQPVINIADGGMGTWVLRGKNHKDSNTLSGHSMGTTIDINPSTGSFLVNGTWYGNAYGNQPMPYGIWEQLPECHKKYHVLYVDCPIVRIFKSYGFYWGGDWSSSKDCMHLSFLGDGENSRQIGQQNYFKYSR